MCDLFVFVPYETIVLLMENSLNHIFAYQKGFILYQFITFTCLLNELAKMSATLASDP